MAEKMRIASAHQLALKNRNCIYCGITLTKETRNREHVIGRNFVPPGSCSVNLIAWACFDCNGDKSNLEDDVSLISLLPALGDQHSPDDPRLAEIVRKAKKAISRRTGKPVKDSTETLTVGGQIFPGVNVTFNLMSNPQTDSERVGLLAMHHVQAFFYFTTYNSETQTGACFPGTFSVVGDYRRPDWGNPRLGAFMSHTKDWDPRVSVLGNDSYFRIISRRNLPLDLWSWAVEWNKNFRVCGFFGAEALVDEATAAMPKLRMKDVGSSGNSHFRMRMEEGLPDKEDILFHVSEEQVEAA